MDRLSFATLEKQGYSSYLLKDAPERVVQFGEGNFLRAFADCFVDLMNEKAGFNSKVVLVQPRGGHPEAADRFAEQDGLYTLILPPPAAWTPNATGKSSWTVRATRSFAS